jgi:hypothetical protein
MMVLNVGDLNLFGELNSRRDDLREKRSRMQKMHHLFTSLSIFAIVILPFLLWASSRMSPRGSLLLPAFAVYCLAPATYLPALRGRLRDIENEIQELDFQIDLQQFEIAMQERRAEKILRINQLQLRRYYDMNLSQNFWVFSVGVFCVLLGVAVIAASLYLVLHVDSESSKIIIAALGAVGGVLTNFVAAIYLRMNTSASQNLAEFHAGLLHTHQLLIANLLASRIQNEEERSRTLSELATGLAKRERPASAIGA